MRIVLHQNIKDGTPHVGQFVGTIDGKLLSFVERVPYIDGEPATQEHIALALSDAVTDAASQVFGGEWSTDLARVTGLNRRTVTKDRIERYGLAPWVLAMLGRWATSTCPRARGYLLLAGAELIDRGPYAKNTGEPYAGATKEQHHHLWTIGERELNRSMDDVDYSRRETYKYKKSKSAVSNA
ncbi:hypothetical protein MKK55_18670 [Methylobacterium sp. J-059]|uniref:hypothetical protein n=1 Tax=Methylobacterium sp. J-059 TaxID=2836643 RepID=UPI001FBA5A12|nr:hypothetical protein [Methylobacterium sp. J-059]MCJ2040955.1 hypothetical protein [Methylobacterium sp. J-059]